MKHKRFTLLSWVLALGFLVPLGAPFAQWTVQISALGTYDQNSFRNYQRIPDWIQQVSLTLGRDVVTSSLELSLSYNGGFVLFVEYPERRFSVHTIALDGTAYLAGGRFPLEFGVAYGWRIDRETYSIYDHKRLDLYVAKRFPGVQGVPEIGVTYTNRNYPNLPEYSHAQWGMYAVLRHFFPTRTTIIVRPSFGYRAFAVRVIQGEFVPTEWSRWHAGRASGWMHGRGMERGAATTHLLVDAPEISLWTGELRLAQSLGEKTGVSVVWTGWYSFGSGSRALDRAVYGYDPSDLLYDDPYNHNGDRISLQFNRLLWSGGRLQLGVANERRNYRELPALDFSGNEIEPERKDRRLEAWATVQSPLPFGLRRLSFILEMRWLGNDSNDPYYTWDGYTASVGLQYIR